MEEVKTESQPEENIQDSALDKDLEMPELLDSDKSLESIMEIDNLVLQTELADTKAKANEYLDGWQRSRADFSNYKKRVERDQADVYQRLAGNIIKRFIEVLDDLDLALMNRPTEGEGATWANGIEHIYRKLLSILENEGVKPMIIENDMFDPNFHEAISSEPSNDHASGQVIEVIKQGYMLGEKVLRPALVRVAQ